MNDRIKIEKLGDEYGEFETVAYMQGRRSQASKILRVYSLVGRIGKLLVWPFLWPIMLFEHLAGSLWFTDEYDAEFYGAIALQIAWVVFPIFALLLLTVSE